MTKRQDTETVIEYLMRLSAQVGESRVIRTRNDGEGVPYATESESDSEMERRLR